MTDQEFKNTWEFITMTCRTAQLIPIEDVQMLLETVSHAHAIGPMIDPTAYRNGMDNLDDQKIIAEAFLGLRRAIEKVASRSVLHSEKARAAWDIDRFEVSSNSIGCDDNTIRLSSTKEG